MSTRGQYLKLVHNSDITKREVEQIERRLALLEELEYHIKATATLVARAKEEDQYDTRVH